MCKVFKLENNNEFREGDKIIRIELSKAITYVLNWVYVGVNEINFNSKIKDIWVFIIEIEKELKG